MIIHVHVNAHVLYEVCMEGMITLYVCAGNKNRRENEQEGEGQREEERERKRSGGN